MSRKKRPSETGAEADSGGNLDGAMAKLRPPLNYFRKSVFKSQASRWSAMQLEEALAHLYEGEALTKTTGVPAEAVAARALLAVAAMTRMRN